MRETGRVANRLGAICGDNGGLETMIPGPDVIVSMHCTVKVSASNELSSGSPIRA